MNIAIIGLGLIGGSLAKAFSEYTGHTVLGLDRDKAVETQALSSGAIHEIAGAHTLRKADVLYLCLYPQDAVAFVKAHHAAFKPGCIVTDTAGIKTYLCAEMAALARQYGFIFVGSHPMAGKERNTFAHAEASLFNGASYIVVPLDAPKLAVDTIEKLALQLGFSSIRRTTPEEHDRMIAFTSQLPHVLACAYVMSPQCISHKGFSAVSYRGGSMVARMNEALWSELFLENQQPLIQELTTLQENISKLKSAIERGDRETLSELLKQGREIKEALGE